MDDRGADREVLATMRSHGADLTRPAHIMHFLYFNSMNAANAAADELRAAGFEKVGVHRAPAKSLWRCQAHRGHRHQGWVRKALDRPYRHHQQRRGTDEHG